MKGKFIKISISICTVVAFMLTSMSLFAQGVGGRVVDVKIYFPYDEAYLDSTYMGNYGTLTLADSLLKDSAYISTLHKIEITAQSSPEGRVNYNMRLSERRKQTLKKYFTENYPQIDPTLWSFNAVAENWELFHRQLVEDPNLPNRDRVIAISESDRDPDGKEWLLKTMNDGRPWRYIKENILPSQRFGASILFIPMLYSPIAKIGEFKPEMRLEKIGLPQYTTTLTKESKLLFAIKTNLVLDAVSVINIAAELPIGERWSVVGEVVYPWWRSWEKDLTMQIESYHAELKYWLGDRTTKEQLQGWSVGAYGGWGRYDIQPFTRTGVQGAFTDVGLEIGYAHPIARSLNLEYTVGCGYVSTKYEDYKMVNNTDEYGDIKVIPYPWMQNRLRSVLPTRCGVSLVWTIKNARRR